MPKGAPTTLFISSTCYDLAQIRADLRDFAVSLGYEPVLSELDSFPINPSMGTVANCLEAVRTRADLFVLVVGGRYGSITDTGLSVTNLEFIEAAAKAIPIFVFVKTEILTLLPVWKSNPSIDFSSTVDSPKLFEFVSTLREKGNLWVFPFSFAQDITAILRRQLSYLMADCLSIRSRLHPADAAIQKLGPESLRTYLERPRGWKYLVLAQCMREQVQHYEPKRLDLELGISFGPTIHLKERTEALAWITQKFDQIAKIIQNISTAVNNGYTGAVGPAGTPGDINRIIHLASRFGEGYSHALDWTLEFKCIVVDADLEKLAALASGLSANMLRELRQFAEEFSDKLAKMIESVVPGDSFKFVLTLTIPDTSEYLAEISRLLKDLPSPSLIT